MCRSVLQSVEIGWKDIGDIYLAATGDADGVEDWASGISEDLLHIFASSQDLNKMV